MTGMSANVEEFYNRCHAGSNGKFCGTAGGNKAGRTATQRATAHKAAVAKVGTSGSKIVNAKATKAGAAHKPSSPGEARGKGNTIKKATKAGHGSDANASRLLSHSGSKSWGVNSKHSNKGKRVVTVSKKVLTKMESKKEAHGKTAPAPKKAETPKTTAPAAQPKKAETPKTNAPKSDRVMRFLDKASSTLSKLAGERSGTMVGDTSRNNARRNSEITRRKREKAYQASR